MGSSWACRVSSNNTGRKNMGSSWACRVFSVTLLCILLLTVCCQIKLIFQQYKHESVSEKIIQKINLIEIRNEYTPKNTPKSVYNKSKSVGKSVASGDKVNTKPHNFTSKHIHIFLQLVVETENKVGYRKAAGISTASLVEGFAAFIRSLIETAEDYWHLEFIINADSKGRVIAEDVFLKLPGAIPKRVYLDSKLLADQLKPVVAHLKKIVGNADGSYFDAPLFYLPAALHRLPALSHLSRLIMLDVDLRVKSDIAKLHAYFKSMGDSLYAMANEQAPFYRHVTHKYQQAHPSARVGLPGPQGQPGYNSGVVLLNLVALRSNHLYNTYLDNPGALKKLSRKYGFRSSLGDQDFYTLLSFEHPHLFFTLPCQWNRQLCRYWEPVFPKLFPVYNKCQLPYHILHANCRSKFPEE